ncbi:MAG: HD-GYP domain-containing protein [Lachnospiraceae bacterium]|nr:HD-GYP domain-containing protein [Lachnospiraceae bacterium]
MLELIRMHQLNIMLILAGVCGLVAFFASITTYMSKRRKITLILLEVSGMFLLVFDRYAYVFRGDVSYTGYWMVRVSNFMVFLLTLCSLLLFNLYLTDLLLVEGGMKKMPEVIRISCIILAVGIVILIISQFTGLYYTFNEKNEYVRSSSFILSYLFPVVSLVLSIVAIFRYAGVFSKEIRMSLKLFSMAPLFAAALQFFVYGLSLINISIALMCLVVYVFSLVDMNHVLQKAHRQEIEYLEEQRKNMSTLFEETAVSISSAIDINKSHTSGHSSRVAVYSREIARVSGESEEICEQAYFAGLLHDVGKLGIPDAILNKKGELTGDEEMILREHAVEGSKMLSGIRSYPYLGDVARYHHERYDGKGYPDGLKGEDIPKLARIVAVADAYDIMTSDRIYRGALPQPRVREDFLKESGLRFDPVYAKAMLKMIDSDKDYSLRESTDSEIRKMKTELDCEGYRSDISVGVPVKNSTMRVRFRFTPKKGDNEKFAIPTLILFDSLDGCVHNSEQAIVEYNYVEYAEVWFDGHTISTRARNIEMRQFRNVSSREATPLNMLEAVRRSGIVEYTVEAGRYKDHIRIRINSGSQDLECIVALPDNTRYTYIALTGESCLITGISIDEIGPAPAEGDIPRIADEIVYTDRMESDLKNIQIDTKRSDHTSGVEIQDGMRIAFHSRSLPASHLVWHCPYVVLYQSKDKKVHGEGYRELVLVRLDGEIEEVNPEIDNRMVVTKTEAFDGWDTWKNANRRGMEYIVNFRKRGNRITVTAENAGIVIKNTTVIESEGTGVYAALTGDQVALTDIRVI